MGRGFCCRLTCSEAAAFRSQSVPTQSMDLNLSYALMPRSILYSGPNISRLAHHPEPEVYTRTQVESFVLVLRGLLRGRSLDVVDFCSGTGNLLLPLAALFPLCRFHAVEMKPNAVAILLARAAAARLTNVTAEVWRAAAPSTWL